MQGWDVTEVDAVDMHAVLPLGEVRLGGEPQRGVVGEPSGDDCARATPEKLQGDGKPNLHPATRDKGNAAGEVRVCAALGEVEVTAAHAHLVVEVVELAVGDATDAALLGVAEKARALLSARGER